MSQSVCILGATGSIGESTLKVLQQHPEQYSVFAVTAYSRLEKLVEICKQFRPQIVVVPSTQQDRLADLFKQHQIDHTEILTDESGLVAVAEHSQVDIVMAAIVGAAGLLPTLAAVKAGKRVLLANKEALVMSGDIMMRAAEQHQALLLPVDSEHNAIFQCLPNGYCQSERTGQPKQGVSRILLTASGGPFLNQSFSDMQDASVAEAVKHPNWSMGQKISVDSATMMNKGLELIEASFLFDMPVKDIGVVMHPQSIVHSMVEYTDGSILAQLGSPDMRTPIAHALAYPERISSGVERLDLFALSNLQFLQPDLVKFKCLALAYQAMQAGSYACIALNASNEISVKAFLEGQIRLTDIADVNEQVLNQVVTQRITDLAEILAVDTQARTMAAQCINQL